MHTVLVEEKTFEAPLSFFYQFGTAFYLSDNLMAFAIIMLSNLTSLIGIANGLYIANHLSFVDVEDADDPSVHLRAMNFGIPFHQQSVLDLSGKWCDVSILLWELPPLQGGPLPAISRVK